jgi:hypothetical protein
MIEPELCQRIEETNPTDRVRGTIVNVTSSLFVVKYDNGDYAAYDTADNAGAFHDASDKPVPRHAADLIHRLRKKHGTTPPEDVGVLRIEDNNGIPHPRSQHMRDAPGTLTEIDEPPSIEA